MSTENADALLAEPFEEKSIQASENVDVLRCSFTSGDLTSDLPYVAANCPKVINCEYCGFNRMYLIGVLQLNRKTFFVGVVAAV